MRTRRRNLETVTASGKLYYNRIQNFKAYNIYCNVSYVCLKCSNLANKEFKNGIPTPERKKMKLYQPVHLCRTARFAHLENGDKRTCWEIHHSGDP